jgi:hypothetical protein
LRQLATIFKCDGKKEEAVLSDVLLYMREMTNRERLLLSEIAKVLKLVLVMPATNSTSERSFSTLRRIKIYLRSTMRQDRLNDLMILHVHKDKTNEMKLQETFVSGNIDKTFLDNSNSFYQRYHVPVKSRVTMAKAVSKPRKSRDKDEAKKMETETTNNIQKLKENTQKTKSKRATRTPPKTGSMDQVHR